MKTGADDFIVAKGVDALREVIANAEPLYPTEELTDVGNAMRLARRAEGWFLFVPKWGHWYTWDDRRWVKDAAGQVRTRAIEVVKDMLLDARKEDDPDERKRLVTWALKSQERKRIDSMVSLVANVWPPLLIDPTDLDRDRWLLNIENGTIDLRTGLLRPHDPDDLITRLAPVAYDPEAHSELWERSIAEILPDAEERGFLQRWLGYALTGDVREEKLAFLQGSGRNGKGTIIETALAVFGDYAGVAPEALLLARKFDSHPTELADLFGKRLVIANEVGQGRTWNAARVKMLTGGDRVKARRMHEDFWEFDPTHKITVLSNPRPRADAEDVALWERLKVVPFEQSFAGKEKFTLKSDLRREALPAVLAWLVRGCLEWQRTGLGEPAKVRQATAEYRAELRELDPLGVFLASYHLDGSKGRPLQEVVQAFNAYAPQRKITSREARSRLEPLGYVVRKGSKGAIYVFPPGDQPRTPRPADKARE